MDIAQKARNRLNWRAFREAPKYPRPGGCRTGPFACFDCRKSWKRPAAEDPTCPECGGPLRSMGRKFKAPRRGDRRGWDQVRAAWAAGRRFGKLPRNGPPPLSRR